MKILKLLIRVLFKFKAKRIGPLEKGGCYIMAYEAGVILDEDLKLLLKYTAASNIKLYMLPVLSEIDKIKFI
jgi:hypothetical protein